MTFILKTMRRALFDHRIRQMRAAFHAACAPFFQELEEIKQEADDFQRRVDAGTAQWEEYDEETGAGRHYGEEFGERRLEAEAALLLVRKAFVIVIYHLWERGARRWAPQARRKPNHADLVAALTEALIVIDKAGLEELRLLVNCLKHNSEMRESFTCFAAICSRVISIPTPFIQQPASPSRTSIGPRRWC